MFMSIHFYKLSIKWCIVIIIVKVINIRIFSLLTTLLISLCFSTRSDNSSLVALGLLIFLISKSPIVLSPEHTLIVPTPTSLCMNERSNEISIIRYSLTSSSLMLKNPLLIKNLSLDTLYLVNDHGSPRKRILFLSFHNISVLTLSLAIV